MSNVVSMFPVGPGPVVARGRARPARALAPAAAPALARAPRDVRCPARDQGRHPKNPRSPTNLFQFDTT